MALEPIPKPEYIPPIGYYFLSAGKTILYQCVSYPLCRIYWDAGKATAWTTESAWFYTGDPKKGWRRDGANYPSFLACCYDDCRDTMGSPQYITLRHQPLWAATKEPLLTIIREKRAECLQNPIHPQTINLTEKVKTRMIACM